MFMHANSKHLGNQKTNEQQKTHQQTKQEQQQQKSDRQLLLGLSSTFCETNNDNCTRKNPFHKDAYAQRANAAIVSSRHFREVISF